MAVKMDAVLGELREADEGVVPTWDDISGKPETFPPAEHTHAGLHTHVNAGTLAKFGEDASGNPLFGGTGLGGENPGTKFMVCRIFAHDDYEAVAYLDENNSMELAGYYAGGIGRIELYLVSANPACSGNIVLTVNGESFTVLVGAAIGKVTLVPVAPLSGKIAIARNAANAADTLKNGNAIVAALAVDWRCF